MARILVVDDESGICRLLKGEFIHMGHDCDTAQNLSDARELALRNSYDVVYLDVNLPDGNGLEEIPFFRTTNGQPEIVVMTGYGDPDGAELAIRNGAWDFLEKPPSINQFTLTLLRVLQYREQSRTKSGVKVLNRPGLIGDSPALQACLSIVAEAAPSEANVLITGETGTGKEVVARVIHDNSPRSAKPFVVVDCASLPENLVESALFGHRKGAFTGADRNREGLLAQAHGGTLFLDEIGELPIMMQKSLLRVLQERRYRPIGAVREQEVDFRLVAATNRELESMVEEGGFRQDLLFRIKTFIIQVPPLRDRMTDIFGIVNHYATQLCLKYGISSKGFSPDFLERLKAYPWPGNVRELINVVELVFHRAFNDPTIFAKHLPVEVLAKSVSSTVTGPVDSEPAPEPLSPAREEPDQPLTSFKEYRQNGLDRIEKEYLVRLISVARGELARALEVSGLSRTRFYSLLKKHGLSLK